MPRRKKTQEEAPKVEMNVPIAENAQIDAGATASANDGAAASVNALAHAVPPAA